MPTIETALLNILQFPKPYCYKSGACLSGCSTMIRSSSLVSARSQGVDGGLTAARAAYIGGCAGTSNLQAGQQFGIPVSGTQAHSWIMFFENEREAFKTYAEAMPNNCIFLVDTYDSIDGIRHAIEIGSELRRQGHEMIGVRLDSGDGVALSIKARKCWMRQALRNAKIVGSGDLDEYMITNLKQRGAKIDVWGVEQSLAPVSRMALSVASTSSARSGALAENGNTALNFRKNQLRRQSQAHCRSAGFISRTADSLRTRSTKIIMVFLSPAKSSMLRQKTKRKSLPILVLQICSCRFATPANLFMNRRTIETSREHLRKQLSCAPPEILQLTIRSPTRLASNSHCTNCDRR